MSRTEPHIRLNHISFNNHIELSPLINLKVTKNSSSGSKHDPSGREGKGMRASPTPLSSSQLHPLLGSFASIRRLHRRYPPPANLCSNEHYQNNATKYWDKFYKRHQNKFFKDRHYLEKDWGAYFSDDHCGTSSTNGKVLLEVGCGAGNTIFPLVAAYPKLYVHACDFSPHAIELVKCNVDFRGDRVNAFVCDVTNEGLSDKIRPSSVDIITLIFMLSAVSPNKMPLILQNLKKVLKPHGVVLIRDYAIGDFAQVKLQDRNQKISENFYVRSDGTCSFYFSEEFLSNLFSRAGFTTVDVHVYCKQIENRSRNVTMNRRWIRAIFSNFGCNVPDAGPI